MNRKDLVERVMKVAEHYKNGDLYGTGAMTDIGILIDEYTETLVKKIYIPDVVEKREKLCHCGNKEDSRYSPCCSLEHWHDRFS